MPSLDKNSVRKEVERLKADFDELCSNKKVSKDCKILFQALFAVIALILSIFMEKTTKKTSENSSKPSSQTDKDETSLSNKKNSGKGKGEKVTQANNTRTIETIETIEVNQCKQCGRDLSNTKCQCVERRTRIDIVFEKTVEHVETQVKKCPRCQTTNKGKFPKDMSGPLQYGNGIKAYIIQLLVMQMMSLNRVSKLLATLIGQVISEATLLSMIMRLHLMLEPWELAAKKHLLDTACINTDETSFRVDKKKHWIHVYSSGDITLQCLHRKRGKQAIEDIGIIPKYKGVIVHDCWCSYLSYKHCGHGLCGSHLLRELTFAVDAHNYKWAKNMKKLLKETAKAVAKSKGKVLSKKKYQRLQRRYRNILTRAEKELPLIIKKPNTGRGKIAKSDAHNLCERLRKHEEHVLLFARKPEVPFTNNRSERDLRMSKVKQKVSGCFRTEKYAHAYCRISSFLETMKNKGINPLIAINMALSGKIVV